MRSLAVAVLVAFVAPSAFAADKNEEKAKEAATALFKAIKAKDVDAVMKLTGTPFVYRDGEKPKVLKEIDGTYGKFSLLEVRIETGRTHQIRVHLASTGHSVVGDKLYGAPQEIAGTKASQPPVSLKRNFLHAAAVQLKHPVDDSTLSLEQPLPDELKKFLRQIGG